MRYTTFLAVKLSIRILHNDIITLTCRLVVTAPLQFNATLLEHSQRILLGLVAFFVYM